MKVKFIVILLLFFSFSCARKETRPPERVFSVTVIEPEKKDLSLFSYFTGVIRAKEEVKVYPRVEGKIDQKLIAKGDSVEKGQLLFTIDRDIVGYRFEKARVDSPISGRVGLVYVDTGQQVGPQLPLALVQNDSIVKAKVWAGERDYPLLKKGQVVYLKVGSYPGRYFEGKVSEVSPFFDSETHTALIKIEVANPERELKPGMFAEVKIKVAFLEQVLTILFDSILEDDQGEYVYLLEQGRAKKRYLETGLSSGEYLEVISGLSKGEKIIYRGKEFVEEGMAVKAQ